MTTRMIINIDVPGLEAGIRFYADGLGFRFVRVLFGGSVAELTNDAGAIFLIEQSQGSQPIPGEAARRDYQRQHWTPVHIDLPVADIDTAVARALAAGAVAGALVTRHAFGRLAPMRDPFGHGFCLIEFNAAGYDAAAV